MYVPPGNEVSRLCLKLIRHEKFDMNYKARFASIIRDELLFQPRVKRATICQSRDRRYIQQKRKDGNWDIYASHALVSSYFPKSCFFPSTHSHTSCHSMDFWPPTGVPWIPELCYEPSWDLNIYYIGSAEGHEYPNLQVGDEVDPRLSFCVNSKSINSCFF